MDAGMELWSECGAAPGVGTACHAWLQHGHGCAPGCRCSAQLLPWAAEGGLTAGLSWPGCCQPHPRAHRWAWDCRWVHGLTAVKLTFLQQLLLLLSAVAHAGQDGSAMVTPTLCPQHRVGSMAMAGGQWSRAVKLDQGCPQLPRVTGTR